MGKHLPFNAVVQAYGVSDPWEVSQVMSELMLKGVAFMLRIITSHNSTETPPEGPTLSWASASAVALRTLATLHWLDAPVKTYTYFQANLTATNQQQMSEYVGLKKMLATLACSLLLGNSANLQHDMQGIFRFGLETVLGAWCRFDLSVEPLTRLGLAFLKRLATDVSLLSQPEGMHKSSDDWVMESNGVQAAAYLL